MKNEEITAALIELTNAQTKIRKKDLLRIASIRDNPITKHLLKKFTKNSIFEFDKLLDKLKEFALGVKLPPKIEFLFVLYDYDGDGIISRLDLFNIIKMFSDEKLTDVNIQNIVDRCFLDMGCNEIDLEKFRSFIESSNPNLKLFMGCQSN